MKRLALMHTKHTAIHDIVRPARWQMRLLKEAQSVSNSILNEVTTFCENVSMPYNPMILWHMSGHTCFIDIQVNFVKVEFELALDTFRNCCNRRKSLNRSVSKEAKIQDRGYILLLRSFGRQLPR
jgi:hypothetical protein